MDEFAMNNGPFASAAPARLYAFLLKLRPLRSGTLMPFSGELVHGAWLNWLRGAAPDVATWLHDGNRRRFFTCSSLQFPISPQRALEVELNNDAPSGWTGFTSLSSLVEKTRRLRLGPVQPLTLEFASLTTFNRNNMRSRSYGAHYARLPLPQYVFPGLLRRWEDIAPPELAGVVQKELIERYIDDDGVIVTDYDLRTHRLKFTTHQQQGFIGTCKYHLRGSDDEARYSVLSIRQQLLLLAQLAFYCGVGYKTSMGMGRVRPLETLQTARLSRD